MKLHKHNTGFNTLTLLCYLTTIAVVVLGAIKIAPSYYDGEFFVKKGLKSLQDDPKIKDYGRSELKTKLIQYFTLNNVRGEPSQNVKVTRYDEGYLVNVEYTIERELFSNIKLKMDYKYQLNTATGECCEFLIENDEKK